jgi:hypothetical protein
MPKRIQRMHKKGWKVPENCAYVGGQTKFGNPFSVGCYARCGERLGGPSYRHDIGVAYYVIREPRPGFVEIETRRQAVDWYRRLYEDLFWNRSHIEELRGKDLACWCPLDKPCHADVLLEIANR